MNWNRTNTIWLSTQNVGYSTKMNAKIAWSSSYMARSFFTKYAFRFRKPSWHQPMSAFDQAWEVLSLCRMRKKYQTSRTTTSASLVLREMCWRRDLKGRATKDKCYVLYEKSNAWHLRGFQGCRLTKWFNSWTLSAKKQGKRRNLGWMDGSRPEKSCKSPLLRTRI